MFEGMTIGQILVFFLMLAAGITILVVAAVLIITRANGTTATKIAIEVAGAVRMDKATLDLLERGVTQTIPKDALMPIVNMLTSAITLAASGSPSTSDVGQLADQVKTLIKLVTDGLPNDMPTGEEEAEAPPALTVKK